MAIQNEISLRRLGRKRQAEGRQENSLLVDKNDDASLCMFMESQRAGSVRKGAMVLGPMQQCCVDAGGTAAGCARTGLCRPELTMSTLSNFYCYP